MKKKNVGSSFDGWLREEGMTTAACRHPSFSTSPAAKIILNPEKERR